MARVRGGLLGGGLVPSPVRVGPLVPADRTPTYLAPVFVARQVFTNVAAASTNALITSKTSTALPGAAGSVTFTPDGALVGGVIPQPRNVVITVTHASAVVAANGVITGRDEYGAVITEDWSVTAGGTSKTYTGKKAFAVVTSISYVTAANAQANTFIAGTGNVLGLQFAHVTTRAVIELSAGTVVTNGTFVAATTTATEDRRGTYAPNTAPNGSTTYEVFYLVADPSAGVTA